MEIMWESDKKAGEQVVVGDKTQTLKMDERQTCYQKIGTPYINGTRKIRETNKDITDKEKALWDSLAALVKKYENSGLIKTMEQVRAEEEEAKRRGKGK